MSVVVNTNENMNIKNKENDTTKFIVVEYIFIDGFNTTRSKTRIIPSKIYPDFVERGLMFNINEWNVDGSSTGQSNTRNSDIILIPRTVFRDPFNTDTAEYKYYLCICEILNNDGTPHITNNRSKLFNTMMQIGEESIIENAPVFGIEQEYVILDSNGIPYKCTANITDTTNDTDTDTDTINDTKTSDINCVNKHLKYYCSVGGDRNFGREIAMEHMNKCLYAGIMICGINAEVAPSQWEFQIGICNPFEIGDNLWVARYILARVAEKYNAYISYDPKPFGINWSGSGAHTNFSTKAMRGDGGMDYIKIAIDKLANKHMHHMLVYGEGNERRLTGMHETSAYDTFTYGECDRGSSIRIPINVKNDCKGYLEDRRPASNIDPYLVCTRIIETILGT